MNSKRLKKWCSVAMVSMVVVGTLSGCGSSGKESSKEGDGEKW